MPNEKVEDTVECLGAEVGILDDIVTVDCVEHCFARSYKASVPVAIRRYEEMVEGC